MRAQSNATDPAAIAVHTPRPTLAAPIAPIAPAVPAVPAAPAIRARGTALAALGVVTFSLTFPATAWGLEGFGPWSLVTLRCVLAALIAGSCLLALRVRVPARAHWAGLAVVAAGVVVGFPLLTTLALRTSTTAHAAVVVGLLPLTTAGFAALRTGTRPSRTFWLAALAGAGAVIAFTVWQSGGALTSADLYLFGALLVCAAGYTEGGRLARVMPGWQVIGWALVACLPLAVPAAAAALADEPVHLTGHSVVGLVWVAAVSQFLGLVVWYRGMAAIGVPHASQLQLAQPLLTLAWSVLLLGEHLPLTAPLTALAVLACIAVTQRARG
ncbi:DMT family transporter [Streptomyces sp. NPDC087425]|uniref:DMT family transporter n=1 Tax=Streptomyces sp. NPDC087425 TaxID=3365787 RepID=UPI00381C039E